MRRLDQKPPWNATALSVRARVALLGGTATASHPGKYVELGRAAPAAERDITLPLCLLIARTIMWPWLQRDAAVGVKP